MDRNSDADKIFECICNADGDGIITKYHGTAEDIIIPAKIGGVTIKEIGVFAFHCCRNLQSVSISAGIKKIAFSAFSDCENLKSVKVDYGLSEISKFVFSGCRNLENIELPRSINNIGSGTFSGCSNLKNFKSPLEKIFRYGDFICEMKILEGIHIHSCISQNSVLMIPEFVKNLPVTAIDDFAFSGCQNLETVSIPKFIYDIGFSAFSGCQNLKFVRTQKYFTDSEIIKSFGNKSELKFLQDF